MEVVVGGTYRHFKGHIYKVLMIANDADTPVSEHLKKLVIYQNVMDNSIWARKLEDFMSKVDKNKYPMEQQKYRFELISND